MFSYHLLKIWLRKFSSRSEKPGKFWVYERIIRIPYYTIYEVNKEEAQLQRLRAEQAELKAAKLAARLREMSINTDDDL